MGDPVQSTISDPDVDDLAFHHMKDMLRLGTHLRFGPVPGLLLIRKRAMTTAFHLREILCLWRMSIVAGRRLSKALSGVITQYHLIVTAVPLTLTISIPP
jgi:hypothetical protein